MRRADPALPEVFDRAELRRAGLTPSQAQRRLQRGTWLPLRRGVFCLRSDWEAADRGGRHRLRTLAAVAALGGEHVASHASAAVVHGYPLSRGDVPVWLTTTPGQPTRYLSGLVVQSATVRPADRWTVRGLPTTSPARTVVDCLRHLPAPDAVAVADAALRGEPDLARHLRRVLEDCGSWPYAARAHARLELVDGRRESHAESWSFVLMHRWDVPLPEPQVLVRDGSGAVVARVDALWDERLVGEVDGLVKYGVGTGDSLEEGRRALVREKAREDRLRDLGLDVVRWGVADLARPQAWAARLKARLASPHRRPVTARFTYSPAVALLTQSPAGGS